MEKKLFNGYFCQKCKSIPLIEILPKNQNTSIFLFCKCQKRYQSLDLFNKNYYKENIELKDISSEKYNIDYNISFINNSDREKYINNFIKEYNKTKIEFNTYSKEIKDKLINSLMLKIQKVNDAYEKYLLINKKIENIIEILIKSYEIFDDNINNIKNLINNSNFNIKPKFFTSSFESAISFYEKEFIIKISEQMKTVKIFYNHLRGVNCFIDYKINKEYYGVSSSYDSTIALYDLIENKHLFTFCGDKDQIKWITLSFKKNIISCGNDKYIKIWPIINNEKILELNNVLSNGKKINLKALFEYQCKEIVYKLEYIINKEKDKKYDHLLGGTRNAIYLFQYNYIEENNTNNNFINLIGEYNNEKFNNFLFFKRNNISNDLICGFRNNNIILLNYPQIKKINESNKIKISFISLNNCLQLNDKDILFIEFKLLTVFNINKFQKTLSIKMDGVVDCITKLRDGTIIQGGQNGTKRYLQKNFLELPKLNDGYDDDDYYENYIDLEDIYGNEMESILYIRELLDGRIVFCYQHRLINITRLNIF